MQRSETFGTLEKQLYREVCGIPLTLIVSRILRQNPMVKPQLISNIASHVRALISICCGTFSVANYEHCQVEITGMSSFCMPGIIWPHHVYWKIWGKATIAKERSN